MRISDWSSDVCSSDLLTQEPVGVRGLAEVARQHPFLQRPLLSFVQDLPVSKLGPWVVIGWASAFSETDVASDFAATLKGWADQEDRKSVVYGKSVSVRVDFGGSRNIKKKNNHEED